jgi:hypothetical protein
MIIFTVTSLKYFPKTLVMAQSAKAQMSNVKVCVCLVEEHPNPLLDQFPCIDKIVLAKDIGDKNFYKNIFKYTALEAITSVKAQLFLYLMDYYQDEDTFIFLDTDTKIYSPFDEINKLLNISPIIMTPHLLEEEDSRYAIEDNELVTLVYGVYNTAFIAIKRSLEATNFLHWWNNKLKNECFIDLSSGIFVDQRWIDLAICYFDIHILKHPGYNVAAWNLSKRRVSYDNSMYLINNERLRFFHFSGLISGRLDYALQTYVPNQTEPVYGLVASYRQELNEWISECKFEDDRWSYDYFNNGTKIETSTRKKYIENYYFFQDINNPFSKNNEVFFL